MSASKVTSAEFSETVLNSANPVLVDFWAPWCGPCRAIGPMIDELATETEGRATIVKVNVDEEQDLAVKYGVEAIPTLLVFKGGEIAQTFRGVVPKSKLSAALFG